MKNEKSYKAIILECERGFGQKIDEIKLFDNKLERDNFIKSFNSHNTLSKVPDWYMVAVPEDPAPALGEHD